MLFSFLFQAASLYYVGRGRGSVLNSNSPFFRFPFFSALRLACLEFVMHCDSPHACCDRYEPFQNPGLRFSEECWGGGNRSYGWMDGWMEWLIDYCGQSKL